MSVHCKVYCPKVQTATPQDLKSKGHTFPFISPHQLQAASFLLHGEQMPKLAQRTNTQKANAVMNLGHCNHKSLQKALEEDSDFPELELRGL